MDDEVEFDSDDVDSDDGDTGASGRQRERTTLFYEQRLCELTGKIVLAILAKVVDVSDSRAGKFKERLMRHRTRLGRNFKGDSRIP